MPIAPMPYKLLCPACGFSKIVKFNSDVMSMEDIGNFLSVCPKCGTTLEKKEPSTFEMFLQKWL
jgi:rubredoxin